MLFLFVIILSCLIAVFRGGRLNNLRRLPIQHLWLFFVPVILQFIIFRPQVFRFSLSDDAVRIIYLTSMLLAALALWLNRAWPGMGWIISGYLLNLTVINLNGGFMPVSDAAFVIAGGTTINGRFANGIPIGASTVLPWLGDVLPIPGFLPINGVFSPGDVLILVGCIVLTQRALKALAGPQSAPQTAS